MNVITPQSKAPEVAERWRKAYGPHPGRPKWYAVDREETYKRLLALEKPTPEQIADIIGNDSWTRTSCNECENEDVLVVQLGEEPDCDTSTACICLSCLKKALALGQEAMR